MTVTTSHHIDASEPNERGMYDYHYAYTVYVFEQDGIKIAARSYDDDPKVASFAGMQLDGVDQILTRGIQDHPLFVEAVAYLRDTEKKTKLKALFKGEGGYAPIRL